MKTSFDHLTTRQQQDVQIISTLLRDEFDAFLQGKTGKKTDYRILKIILFGSQTKGTQVYDPANGYVSDYDVLVIVNRPALVEEYDIWSTVEEKAERRIQRPLGLIVHTLADINERLHQGQYFFKDICAEGIEIYSTDKRELATPGDLTLAEQKQIAQKYYEHWFTSANGFFKQYLYAMKDRELKIAAFVLHQVAERLYACTLLVTTNYLPKTHDIEKLRNACCRQDPRFQHTFPIDGIANTMRFQKRSFQRLKRAYVDARYSEHFDITEEELTWLASEVEKLKTLTEEVCLKKIGALG
ncbi:HEPN domain-containing protein [Marinomonas agarivorans]|nr:HEPN domain-containing protein [Marinomonas agarivorans]